MADAKGLGAGSTNVVFGADGRSLNRGSFPRLHQKLIARQRVKILLLGDSTAGEPHFLDTILAKAGEVMPNEPGKRSWPRQTKLSFPGGW